MLRDTWYNPRQDENYVYACNDCGEHIPTTLTEATQSSCGALVG